MVEREYATWIDAPVEAVWEFHRSAEALRRLTPPGRKLELIGDDLELREGALHVVRVRRLGLAIEWRARIVEVAPPNLFVDVAEKSPFPSWRHRHEFVPHEGGTLMRDRIEYMPPGGPLRKVVDRLFVRGELDRLFAFRHAVVKANSESGNRSGDDPGGAEVPSPVRKELS